MFNYIVIFGCAAITYLLAEKCSKKKAPDWYTAVIMFVMYAMLDMAVTYLAMAPLGRITRINTVDGLSELSYGSSAVVMSIIIAVLWGILFGFLKKNVDISADVKGKS